MANMNGILEDASRMFKESLEVFEDMMRETVHCPIDPQTQQNGESSLALYADVKADLAAPLSSKLMTPLLSNRYKNLEEKQCKLVVENAELASLVKTRERLKKKCLEAHASQEELEKYFTQLNNKHKQIRADTAALDLTLSQNRAKVADMRSDLVYIEKRLERVRLSIPEIKALSGKVLNNLQNVSHLERLITEKENETKILEVKKKAQACKVQHTADEWVKAEKKLEDLKNAVQPCVPKKGNKLWSVLDTAIEDCQKVLESTRRIQNEFLKVNAHLVDVPLAAPNTSISS
ncbi:hypothetical protein SK128_015795 [Halocaridina rubra]|uniref:Uncharacterized protein n=1 Tax=Halocaridina rubra TaxID=373956 RepID=A0AAN8ZVV7_HALRR